MGGAMRRLGLLTVFALTVSPAVFAQSYRHGRVRHVEEGVSIQRATETGSEEATVNLPFLPGDRVWTEGGGARISGAAAAPVSVSTAPPSSTTSPTTTAVTSASCCACGRAPSSSTC